MTDAEYMDLIKSKKGLRSQIINDRNNNHPHRLELVSFTGTISVTIDERLFTSPGLTASLYTFTLGFANCQSFTRVFNDAFPWVIAFVSPSQGEFYLAHKPSRAWDFVKLSGTQWGSVVIGSCTEEVFTRITTGDPWTSSSTIVTDLNSTHQLGIEGGGDIDSGGFTLDVNGKVSINFSITGDNTDKFSGSDFSGFFYRDPKEDTWLAESAIFATNLASFISGRNALHGGGYSGTSSLTVTFT